MALMSILAGGSSLIPSDTQAGVSSNGIGISGRTDSLSFGKDGWVTFQIKNVGFVNGAAIIRSMKYGKRQRSMQTTSTKQIAKTAAVAVTSVLSAT